MQVRPEGGSENTKDSKAAKKAERVREMQIRNILHMMSTMSPSHMHAHLGPCSDLSHLSCIGAGFASHASSCQMTQHAARSTDWPCLSTTAAKSQPVCVTMQAAQRGKAAAPTQPEPGDPLGSQYGDTPLIQSRTEATETYTSINSLSEERKGQIVSSILPCVMLSA